MYTIFINDAVIYLTDNLKNKDAKSFVHYENAYMTDVLNALENGMLKRVHLYHENIDFLWQDFKKQFTIIEAAGGIVFNELKEVLWIYRHEKWDLPKGKIEQNEDRASAALREVEEECGLTNILLKEFIMTTYHTYQFKGSNILKVSHWFEMFAESHRKLTPQLEEGITKASWLNTIEMNEALNDTYENITLLFENVKR